MPCVEVNRPQEQTPTPVFFALVFFALIEELEKRSRRLPRAAPTLADYKPHGGDRILPEAAPCLCLRLTPSCGIPFSGKFMVKTEDVMISIEVTGAILTFPSRQSVLPDLNRIPSLHVRPHH